MEFPRSGKELLKTLKSKSIAERGAVVGDAARSKVPLSRRLGFWNNSFILWGWVLVLSSFMIGGLVGQAFPLKMSMPIIFFGTLSNGIIGALIGAIAARTGYSSALLYRYTFGKKGVMFPNILMALTSMGWFSVILNMTRDGFVEQMGWVPGSLKWLLTTILIGVFFILPAVMKIRWIAYVDWFVVPGYLAIVIMIISSTLHNAGGFGVLWNKWYDPTKSVFIGFDIAAGGWLVGVTIISDLARFWKNGKQALIGIMSAYAGLVTLQYWGGAIGATHSGEFNAFIMASSLGLGFLAWVALWFGAQSTAQGGTYAAGLAFSAPPLPLVRSQEFTRRLATIGAGMVGLIGSFVGLDRFINWLVQFIGWIVAPIAIIVILDYWAFPSRRQRYESVQGAKMNLNPAAFTAWLVGFAVGWYVGGYTQIFSGLVSSMVSSGLVYYVWTRTALAKGVTPEQQVFPRIMRG